MPILTPVAESLLGCAPAAGSPADLAPTDPVMIVFTSGTSGEPKAAVHGARYLGGQRLQAEHWLDARPGDTVWCTAAAGWSKAARNAFLAPWLMGARVVLHAGRFDPGERLDLLQRERVTTVCMSPTEYRVLARRASLVPLPSLRSAVAAGEQLDPAAIAAWREVGVRVRDGYGQTETGAVSGITPGCPDRDGSMGRPLPGVRVRIADGQLEVDPASLPTFFLGYRGTSPPAGWWATGDLVERDEDGFLWFRARTDDVIISAGYRIDPLEVERALCSHPVVLDAGVIGHPDAERGAIVTAVVVLRDGAQPSRRLADDLQEHVKSQTAPYKYPRRLEFAEALPRTPSGKLSRAALRDRRDQGSGAPETPHSGSTTMLRSR
jgi:acyl-coenzyme A synthetase/AMP-(fatty) acid ligase